MKNLKNAASKNALLLLAFCLFGASRLIAQSPALPCNPKENTRAEYQGYMDHLNANKTLLVRAYLVPADLSSNFKYDALTLEEVLRRSPKVGLLKLTKQSLKSKNCLKATGKAVTLDSAPVISNFTFEWAVPNNASQIRLTGFLPQPFTLGHGPHEANVFFYSPAPGKQGVLLTVEKE